MKLRAVTSKGSDFKTNTLKSVLQRRQDMRANIPFFLPCLTSYYCQVCHVEAEASRIMCAAIAEKMGPDVATLSWGLRDNNSWLGFEKEQTYDYEVLEWYPSSQHTHTTAMMISEKFASSSSLASIENHNHYLSSNATMCYVSIPKRKLNFPLEIRGVTPNASKTNPPIFVSSKNTECMGRKTDIFLGANWCFGIKTDQCFERKIGGKIHYCAFATNAPTSQIKELKLKKLKYDRVHSV